jgi:hypothetical protein
MDPYSGEAWFLKKKLVIPCGYWWVPTRYHREKVTNTGRQLKKLH